MKPACSRAADGRVAARHFSVPEVQPHQDAKDQKNTWTSEKRCSLRRNDSFRCRYMGVCATPTEVRGLLPSQTDELHSSDTYRSAQDILDDCFSTETVSTSVLSVMRPALSLAQRYSEVLVFENMVLFKAYITSKQVLHWVPVERKETEVDHRSPG